MEIEERQRYAKQILDNPVFKMALEELEQATMRSIRGSKPKDIEEREHAYAMLKALEKIENQIKSFQHKNT